MEKIKYEKLYFLSNQVEFDKMCRMYEEEITKRDAEIAKLDAEIARLRAQLEALRKARK